MRRQVYLTANLKSPLGGLEDISKYDAFPLSQPLCFQSAAAEMLSLLPISSHGTLISCAIKGWKVIKLGTCTASIQGLLKGNSLFMMFIILLLVFTLVHMHGGDGCHD